MADLKKLNSDIRASKRKKKVKPRPTPEAPAPQVDFSPLVSAIEKIQQPVVNIEPRDPVAYRVTVDINSRGDMVGATMTPVKK